MHVIQATLHSNNTGSYKNRNVDTVAKSRNIITDIFTCKQQLNAAVGQYEADLSVLYPVVWFKESTVVSVFTVLE